LNPRLSFPNTRFPSVLLKPLGHLSVIWEPIQTNRNMRGEKGLGRFVIRKVKVSGSRHSLSTRWRDSGILVAVLRRSISTYLVAGLIAGALSLTGHARPALAAQGAAATQTTPQVPQPGTPPVGQPAAPQVPAPAVQPAAPAHTALGVVVLDPAHGGSDQGAHGSSGISESEVVLSFARLLRISLEAQGFRVILTRQSNDNPSFDDRSKIVNAQRGAVFITLHVSSIGPEQTVRVYSLPQGSVPAPSPRSGMIDWDHAQGGFLDSSSRLAQLIQVQMAQRFHGSPEVPLSARVRQLRTVAAPAVAIEVSNVSLPDRGPLDQMGPLLADGVARAVAAFRVVYQTGGM
jgi:N-acetylmuramoyl-L-alanine amidase